MQNFIGKMIKRFQDPSATLKNKIIMYYTTIIYYDNYNNIMIVCTKCNSSISVSSFTEKCPFCYSNVLGKLQVECAHIEHNDEKGCGNRNCWKYVKRNEI